MMFIKTMMRLYDDDDASGSWFNLLTLLIVGWCALFALPKVYLNNQVGRDNQDNHDDHDLEHDHDHHDHCLKN